MKHELHIWVDEEDYRAFRIYMDKNGYATKAEAFHNLREIKENRPPMKVEL